MNLKLKLRRFRQPGHEFSTVAPFVVIFGVLACLSLWELRFQDGGRVFIIGENLWAGAQKRAALCLLNYADTHSEADQQCFRTEADVVLGDMQARQALDSRPRSYSVIAEGLIRGRNRPQDVPTAITLYDIAPWNPEVQKAIANWRESDLYFLRLVAVADQLQHSNNPDEARRLKQEVLEIDLALNNLERSFAVHLGNGMHFLAFGLCLVQGIAALALILLAVVISRRTLAVRKGAEQQVKFLAYYDPLTQLPNRTMLHNSLNSVLSSARLANKKVAVLFVDLDRFKIINDSLGHSVGDQLLREVARRLKQCVRDEDIVARVGGDEFLVALPNVADVNDAAAAAERILAAMTVHFPNQGRLFNLGCSIGISLFPAHGLDGETLIRNADAAMYCAKESGRNRLCFFAEEMNIEVLERLTLENNLRVALESEQFHLEYQPQMSIATSEMTGLEVLLRWRHPELGLIAPDTFIQVAENSGLILLIGEWVLRTACRQARKWQDEGVLAVPVAVNVSAVQFRQSGFCDVIQKILRETRLAPQFLELELTESLLLANEDVTFAVLAELKKMGVRLAIDDFGTGYSSLSYLRQFPVGKLKIDRSFITDVASNPDAAAITTAIISMARNLNLKVVAEGVETEEQLIFLRARRCDEIQGYYVSRPVLPEQLPAILRIPQFSLAGFEITATGKLQ